MTPEESLLRLAADTAEMMAADPERKYPSWSQGDWARIDPGNTVMAEMEHLGLGAWFAMDCAETCFALTWAAMVWKEAQAWPALKRQQRGG